MKIIEICTACPGQAVVAARHHNPRPGVTCVWLVDEAHDPDILAAKPADVSLLVMPFSRGGNLNGWPCMTGLVGAFKWAFAQGYDAVIKRDPDTRILDDAQMTTVPSGELAVFVNRGTKPRHRGWGAGYTIFPGAIPILEEAIKYRDWPADKVPEDLFFSFALRKVSWMLPLHACEFKLEKGWPEWKPGKVWWNFNNRRETENMKDVFWPSWPSRE